jgi:corrinoid protein of di/trimethylamine methyltransferase
MDTLSSISEYLQQGRANNVRELVKQAIDEGIAAQDILEKGLLAGMGIIGGKFKNNEVFVPDVLIAARAMNAGTEILKPLLASGGVTARGTVILGTVKGDLHDIGKNLVRMMMEGKGLEVIDLGVDVPSERFVEAAKENNAQIIACSALLTTTMPAMEEVVQKAKEAGIRDSVTIMVGGAPITDGFCDKIGADIYTPDASTAADRAVEACAARLNQ